MIIIKVLFSLSLFISPFIVKLTTSLEVASADEYWENFNIAFGKDVIGTSYSTPRALQYASEYEEILSISTSTASSPFGPIKTQMLCCSGYLDGESLADEYRNEFSPEASLLVPFYVGDDPSNPGYRPRRGEEGLDVDEFTFFNGTDKMCFFVLQTNVPSRKGERQEILDKCTFKAPIPSSLKLSPDIYSSINALYNGDIQSLDSSMNVNVTVNAEILVIDVCNFTAASPDESSTSDIATSGSLISIVGQLSNYNLDAIQNFYWTQSQPLDANTYLSDDEMQRMSVWTALSYTLESNVQTMTLSVEDTPQDPCAFGSLTYEVVDDQILVPIKDYISLYDDSELTAACLAYFSAVVASELDTCAISFASQPELLNYRSRGIIQSLDPEIPIPAKPSVNPYVEAGLLGADVIVGIGDTGLDQKSCYFADKSGPVKTCKSGDPVTDKSKRKVVQYTVFGDDEDVKNGHGTHVCGTVAGNNEKNLYKEGKFAGVAPNAKIAFIDQGRGRGLRVPSIKSLLRNAVKIDTHIFTFSWGNKFGSRSSQRYYGGDYDKYLYKNMDVIIFFAAGNYKESAKDRTLTQQATIKNIVAVGATHSTAKDVGRMAYFSSNGPTFDDRIKPDICAPGMALESASADGDDGSSCDTNVKQGTSMACPTAAGAAALIHEYFQNKKFWKKYCNDNYKWCQKFTPSGPLTKALLLHSGSTMDYYWLTKNSKQNVDISNTMPDHFQGFGRISLANVLPLNGVNDGLDLFVLDLAILNQRTNMYIDVDVAGDNFPLKITIAWYDPPSSGKPAKALIHDLDLELKGPDGRRYYGNHGKRNKRDSVNNNEQITVEKPKNGDWLVQVSARSLPYSKSQKVAVVITCQGTSKPQTNEFYTPPVTAIPPIDADTVEIDVAEM